MCSPTCPEGFVIEKGLSLSALAEDLAHSVSTCRFPNVCQVARKITEERGIRLKEVIESGIDYHQMKFFPSLKRFSHNTHWDKKKLIEIVRPGQAKSTHQLCREISADVLSQIVTKELCFESKLAAFKELDSLPWIAEVLKKIRGVCKDRDHLIQTCTYVSCIALYLQRVYVDYDKLYALHRTMLPMIQKLVSCEILGAFVISGITQFSIRRLHESIPFRLPPSDTRVPPAHQPRVNTDVHVEQQEENMDLVNNQDEEEVITRNEQRHVPACSKGRWSTQELSILAHIMGQNYHQRQQAHKAYVNECLARSIPFRSFSSFKRKWDHLL